MLVSQSRKDISLGLEGSPLNDFSKSKRIGTRLVAEDRESEENIDVSTQPCRKVSDEAYEGVVAYATRQEGTDEGPLVVEGRGLLAYAQHLTVGAVNALPGPLGYLQSRHNLRKQAVSRVGATVRMFRGVTPGTKPPGLLTRRRSGLCSTSTVPLVS